MTDTKPKPFTDGNTTRDGSQLRIEDDGHGGLRVEIHSEQRIAPHVMTPGAREHLAAWMRVRTKAFAELAGVVEALDRRGVPNDGSAEDRVASVLAEIDAIERKLSDCGFTSGTAIARIGRMHRRASAAHRSLGEAKAAHRSRMNELHEVLSSAQITNCTLVERLVQSLGHQSWAKEAERLRALVIEVARRGGVYLAYDGGPSGKPRLPQGPAEEGVVEALTASHKVEMEDVDKLLVSSGRTEGTMASRVEALIKAANRHNVIVEDVEQALAKAGFVEGSIAERVQAALDQCEGAHKALDEGGVGGTRLANLSYRIRVLIKAEATARHDAAKARAAAAGADDRIAGLEQALEERGERFEALRKERDAAVDDLTEERSEHAATRHLLAEARGEAERLSNATLNRLDNRDTMMRHGWEPLDRGASAVFRHSFSGKVVVVMPPVDRTQLRFRVFIAGKERQYPIPASKPEDPEEMWLLREVEKLLMRDAEDRVGMLAEAVNALAKVLDLPAGTLMERVPGIAAERLVEIDRIFTEAGYTKGTVESRAHEIVGKLAAHRAASAGAGAQAGAFQAAWEKEQQDHKATACDLEDLRKRLADLGTQYANERKLRQEITQDTEVGAALRELEAQIVRMRAKGVDETMARGFTPFDVARAVCDEAIETDAEVYESPAAQREAAGTFASALHLVKVHGGTLLDAMKGEAQRLRDRNDWRDAGVTWADAKALLAKGQRASDPPVRMEQPITVTTDGDGGATVHVGPPVMVAPLLPGEDCRKCCHRTTSMASRHLSACHHPSQDAPRVFVGDDIGGKPAWCPGYEPGPVLTAAEQGVTVDEVAPSTEQRLASVSRSVNALAKDTSERVFLLAERVERLERGADSDRMLRLLVTPLERLALATERAADHAETSAQALDRIDTELAEVARERASGGLEFPTEPERAAPIEGYRWMEQGAIASHHVPVEELFVCGLISTVDGSWVTIARDPNDKPPQYFTRSSGFVPLEALEQAIGEARRLWDLEDVPF